MVLKLRPVPPLLFKLVLFRELQQNIFNEGIYEENLVPLRIKLYYYSHSTLNKFTPAIYFKEHEISTHKKKNAKEFPSTSVSFTECYPNHPLTTAKITLSSHGLTHAMALMHLTCYRSEQLFCISVVKNSFEGIPFTKHI